MDRWSSATNLCTPCTGMCSINGRAPDSGHCCTGVGPSEWRSSSRRVWMTSAPELAHHFEEGGDWKRAVKYLRRVADVAGKQGAPLRAKANLEHALTLAARLPGKERVEVEVGILDALLSILIALTDPAAAGTATPSGASRPVRARRSRGPGTRRPGRRNVVGQQQRSWSSPSRRSGCVSRKATP